jgi:hypothetical protein
VLASVSRRPSSAGVAEPARSRGTRSVTVVPLAPGSTRTSLNAGHEQEPAPARNDGVADGGLGWGLTPAAEFAERDLGPVAIRADVHLDDWAAGVLDSA